MLATQCYFDTIVYLLTISNNAFMWLSTTMLVNYNFEKINTLYIYTVNTQYYKYLTCPFTTNTPYASYVIRYLASIVYVFNYKHILFVTNVLFNILLSAFAYVLYFSIFFKLIKKISNMSFFFQRLIKENDQEVVSFEDITIYIIFFFSFFINIFNICSPAELMSMWYYSSIWLLFICFFSIVIVVPVSILFAAGSNLFVYIKGVDKSNSLTFLTISDLISMLAFFLRFFLQIIRWILFLTTFYLLHEFVFEWVYGLFVNIFNTIDNKNSFFIFLNNNIFFQIIIHIVRFAFELFDTCLILLIQITAFVAVVLWLFNFLFSLSVENIYENKFSLKYVKKL